MTGRRLMKGGRIDRSRPLSFVFAGRKLTGYAGDTLASALLANGATVLGRSFKYHRPRGLFAAGVEEPNALMEVGNNGRLTPNLRATEVELVDGLVAKPGNCWPSVGFDLGAAIALIARFIPAGFYYKTFMWPNWHSFEHWIRKAAGIGRAAAEPDPDHYEHKYAHCDVLIVGSGPAGLAAALAAARKGSRVMLAEQDVEVGGSLLWQQATIAGKPGLTWRDSVVDELSASDECRVLTRTTAVGYFDHNSISLVERVEDNATSSASVLRHRLWTVRAKRVVLATGAIERPMLFPGNDLPGVMLASAVQQYLVRWAVLAGQRIAVFTNNDSAYPVAHAVLDRGGHVAYLVDSRPNPPVQLIEQLRARGVDTATGGKVVRTHGRRGLRRIDFIDGQGRSRSVACDLLATSGGWNPTVHLFSQSGGTLAWDGRTAGFRPDVSMQAETSAGAADGIHGLADVVASGWLAGGGGPGQPVVENTMPPWTIDAHWEVAGDRKAFVDLQNDVTVADILLAKREAFVSVEHLKRYTTLGMAPDQGKTSNVNALAIMAQLTGRSIPETGTTRFRFPYTPISLGVLAGQERGELYRPLRKLPTHGLQVLAGAAMEEFGGWLRPAHYTRDSESAQDAIRREAAAVRNAAGVFEASPLGKIEVVGPDAAWFLDRIYANAMSTLRVGRARYGLMLNELGVIMDDGVCVRLAEDRFLVGTTSGAADRIADWLEEWLQCEWPDKATIVAPVTTSLAVLAVSGPRARDILRAIGTDIALDPSDFPHMSYREGTVAGMPARVVRASFTGEVTFEINVAWSRAAALWEKLMLAGKSFGIEPVGIDAWMLLRAEKGYLHVGTDTDGATLPLDVGWQAVLKRSGDFVGRRSLAWPAAMDSERHQFVGIEALDPGDPIMVGEHLRGKQTRSGSEGYVTSAGFSPTLGRWVALGFLKRGRARMGEELQVVTGRSTGHRRRVVRACSYDPMGMRLNE